MAPRPDPDAPGLDEVSVGTLDAGPVATVGPGGVVNWGRHRLSWWVRAEDRWHRPAFEASQRRRRLDGLPIVETAVRVPGGDVVATAFGAVVDGGAGVVVEVRNDSAVPVALALVVESEAGLSAAPAGIVVTSGGVVQATREVRDRVAADSGDALLALLELDPADRPCGADAEGRSGAAAMAMVLPLPHTATVGAVVRPTTTGPGPASPAPAVATSAQVGAGWARSLERVPRIDLPDPDLGERWTAAVCDTVVGAAGAGASELGDQLRLGVALARLGLMDEVDPLVDTVLGRIRRDGSLGEADPVGETAGLLWLAAALWSAGVDGAAAEQLVGPVARAARWLERGRRRPRLDDRGAEVAAGLLAAVGFLEDVEQPDLAAHLAAVASALVEGVANRPANASPGHGPAGQLGELLDSVVREVPGGLRLGAGWEPTWAGRAVEVHGVPTRWGRASWALRWHGERPALLWEIEQWADRSVAAPRVTTPVLDPDWSGIGWTGEALLAPPTMPLVGEGSSFS